MTLYSLNRAYPTPPPERIILLSNGNSRTDFSTFSDAEIADAGYVLVPDPPIPALDQVVGWDGDQWVLRQAGAPEFEREWNNVRARRDALLSAADWTQLRDCVLPPAAVQVWAEYRQTLRDLPDKQDNPFYITWPTLPG